MIGPFLNAQLPPVLYNLHCSPFFVIPKVGRPGEYRPLHHCSYPRSGLNLNASLDPQYCTTQYLTLKEIITWIVSIGPKPYLWIVDATDAYFRCPVHPDDWHLLGIQYDKYYLAFTCLPQGSSSSPYIYTLFSDAILYITVNANKKLFYVNKQILLQHYLDDFFGAHNNKKEAQAQYDAMIEWFKKLGLPTTLHKCTPPAFIMKILGWLHNTELQTVKLPEKQRLKCLARALAIYLAETTTIKELQQCIGSLMHASQVYWAGKSFVRRIQRHLFNPAFGPNPAGSQTVTLTDWDKQDLKWWIDILPTLHNGISYQTILKPAYKTDIRVYTDASSKIGIGGWSSQDKCYQTRWENTFLKEVEKKRGIATVDIQLMELLGLIVAAKLWAPTWRGKAVTFYIDNPGAYHAVKEQCAALHRLDMDCLVRQLCELSIKFEFKFWVILILGKNNGRADALSRYYPVNTSYKLTYEQNSTVNFATNNCLAQLLTEPLNGKIPPNYRPATKEFNNTRTHRRY